MIKNRDINIDRMSDFIEAHLFRTTKGAVDGPPPLSSLEFSIHGSCNRRCVFCPRVNEELFPNIKEELPLPVFEKVIRDLASVNYTGRISFSGFSEPLLHKGIVEMIDFAKRTCPEITVEVVSNGDYLQEPLLKRMFGAGLDNLRISLYTPDAKADRFLVMKSRLGLSDEQFIIRKRNVGKDQDYGLTISNRAGMVDFSKVNAKPITEPLKQCCNYPMYKMMVDYTGETLICSNDWGKKRIVGNIHNESILDIWKGEKMEATRRMLLAGNRSQSPCSTCDVNGLMNGEGHREAWEKYFSESSRPSNTRSKET